MPLERLIAAAVRIDVSAACERDHYLGNAGRGPAAAADLHFPGLSAEATRWLAEERGSPP